MSARGRLARVRDWVLRTDPLREARAALPRGGDARAVAQARLLLEVARRVAEPVQSLPEGSQPAALIDLYRDAVYWALVAGRTAEGEGEAALDLKTAWAEAPAERLLKAAGDEATLDAVRGTLVEADGRASLDASADQAAGARAFAEALLWGLGAPERRVERIVGQRWARLLLVGAVAAVLLIGLRALALGPNLAAGKPFRASSSYPGCAADAACSSLLFHTESQLDPWVEFDLGAPETFHRIEVTNRGECCHDRAVPLIAEVSQDRVKWTEVARRDAEFSTWTAKFHPNTARYVRLRVLKQTLFHLQGVAIR